MRHGRRKGIGHDYFRACARFVRIMIAQVLVGLTARGTRSLLCRRCTYRAVNARRA